MPRISAFSIAQKDISKHFDSLKKHIFSIEELDKILDEKREFWRLPMSWNVITFKKALEKKVPEFRVLEIEFPNKPSIKRMIWGKLSSNEIALSLRKSSYLSHYTAMAIHGLTDQVPKVIYTTSERNKKTAKGSLTQKGIDSAFSKPQRISNNIAPLNKKESICWLDSSQYTNKLGVITIDNLRITNIERTLIDATVRPLYCGGIYEVLEAYKRASSKVSISKIRAFLKKIDHTYPYHQAVGLYLEKSGQYKDSQMELLKTFDFKYDFYLSYNMKNVAYSKKWRIYYPESF